MTQKRRTAGKVGATVTFTEDMRITMKKDHFLSNVKNKQQFINMLSQFLQKIGCETYHAQGDADVLIVKTDVESARTRSTVLVGDDTDILVLLCHYTSPDDGCDVYFKPEPKANSMKRRVWNVKKVKQQWGADVCGSILFIHAFVGCDTTSRLHGIGKGAVLKKFVNSPYFREQAKVFDISSTADAIGSSSARDLHVRILAYSYWTTTAMSYDWT
ncbi:hypothetical protein QZH41_001205 [Actinostola sp. cb2023]|nr:hypothetical protein QZH41_001205 [Actinostola sp. cb2023]